MLALIISMAMAQAPEKICMEYGKFEVTECKNDRLGKTAGGAALGGIAGYFLGGKRGALAGAVLGGGTGAISGSDTCTKKIVEECVKWKTPVQ